jgi:hypothetical protein
MTREEHMMKNSIRLTRSAPLAPRNRLVPAALMRHAGPHGGLRKTERQRNRRALRAALHEMNEGP